LIVDDTIQEKGWTDENEIICWHFDHGQGRSIKGVNLLNALYVTTQSNHLFMSIYAVFKLECLKIKHMIQYVALPTKLFIKANQMAYAELQKLQAA
jgi:hypothetical protein